MNTYKKIRLESEYPHLEEKLENFCVYIILHFLEANGIKIKKHKYYSTKNLEKSLVLNKKIFPFFVFMLNYLNKKNHLALIEDQIQIKTNIGEIPSIDSCIKNLRNVYPGFQGIFDLLLHCYRQYDKLFSGKIQPLAILYPNANTNFLQEHLCFFLKNHSCNQIYIRYIIKYLTHLAKTKNLKILEIGGGQGALTWDTVEAMRQYDIEYCFTDISRFLVTQAERKAQVKQVSHLMKCQRYDINISPFTQNLKPQSFDIILSLDTFHVASNQASTLKYLNTLLKRDGALFLIESEPKTWMNMIWGVLPEWWAGKQGKNSPLLLTKKQWLSFFMKLNFRIKMPFSGKSNKDSNIFIYVNNE